MHLSICTYTLHRVPKVALINILYFFCRLSTYQNIQSSERLCKMLGSSTLFLLTKRVYIYIYIYMHAACSWIPWGEGMIIISQRVLFCEQNKIVWKQPPKFGTPDSQLQLGYQEQYIYTYIFIFIYNICKVHIKYWHPCARTTVCKSKIMKVYEPTGLFSCLTRQKYVPWPRVFGHLHRIL